MISSNSKKRPLPFVSGEPLALRRCTTEALLKELKRRDKDETVRSAEQQIKKSWFAAVAKELALEPKPDLKGDEVDPRVIPALQKWWRDNWHHEFWVTVPRQSWNEHKFKCDHNGTDGECKELTPRSWSLLLFGDNDFCLCSEHNDLEHNELEPCAGFKSQINWELLQEQFEEEVDPEDQKLRDRAAERMGPILSPIVRCDMLQCKSSEPSDDLPTERVCFGCARYVCYTCQTKCRKQDLEAQPANLIIRESGLDALYRCDACKKSYCRECKPVYLRFGENQDFCADEKCVPGFTQWRDVHGADPSEFPRPERICQDGSE